MLSTTECNLSGCFEKAVQKAWELKVLKPGNPVLIRGTPMDLEQSRRFSRDAFALMKIIERIPSILFGDDWMKMLKFLKMSDVAIGYVLGRDEKKPKPAIDLSTIARPDFHMTKEGPKILEFNIGVNCGGLEVSAFQRILTESKDVAELMKCNKETYHDSLSDWSLSMQRYLQERNLKRVVLVDDARYFKDSIPAFTVLASELRSLGCDADFCMHSDLDMMEGKLYFNGRPIDLVYPFYGVAEFVEKPTEYQKIMEAVSLNPYLEISGVTSDLFGHKTLLALLRDERFGKFCTPVEKALIDYYIPYTAIFDETQMDRALKEKDSWILKPGDGQSGYGVICGREQSREKWYQEVKNILKLGKLYVIQKYIDVEKEPIHIVDPSGRFAELDSRVLYGIRCIGDQFSGGVLRAVPIDGPRVINFAQGAALGPMLFC
jgi:glutathionylspermidine synthase